MSGVSDSVCMGLSSWRHRAQDFHSPKTSGCLSGGDGSQCLALQALHEIGQLALKLDRILYPDILLSDGSFVRQLVSTTSVVADYAGVVDATKGCGAHFVRLGQPFPCKCSKRDE